MTRNLADQLVLGIIVAGLVATALLDSGPAGMSLRGLVAAIDCGARLVTGRPVLSLDEVATVMLWHVVL